MRSQSSAQCVWVVIVLDGPAVFISVPRCSVREAFLFECDSFSILHKKYVMSSVVLYICFCLCLLGVIRSLRSLHSVGMTAQVLSSSLVACRAMLAAKGLTGVNMSFFFEAIRFKALKALL